MVYGNSKALALGFALNLVGLIGCGERHFDLDQVATKAQPGLVGGATCGDGTHEPGEGCDDGNLTNGDGCSSGCTVEPGARCVTLRGKSTCDSCGNGGWLYGQQCDDGNGFAGDGCSATCTIESGWACTGAPSACHAIVCGDGLVDLPEGCDDGADTSDFLPNRCRTDCQPARCGDGIEDNARMVGSTLVNEVCDHGEANGLPGLCNSSCSGNLDGITSSAPLSFTASPEPFVGLFFSDSLFSAMCLEVHAPGLAVRDEFLANADEILGRIVITTADIVVDNPIAIADDGLSPFDGRIADQRRPADLVRWLRLRDSSPGVLHRWSRTISRSGPGWALKQPSLIGTDTQRRPLSD